MSTSEEDRPPQRAPGRAQETTPSPSYLGPRPNPTERWRGEVAAAVYTGAVVVFAVLWNGSGIDHAGGAGLIGLLAGVIALLCAVYAAHVFGGARWRRRPVGAGPSPGREVVDDRAYRRQHEKRSLVWLPPLAGVDLSEMDLEAVDLRGVDLSGARLGRTRLTRAKLHGALLRRARLDNAILVRATLTDADFGQARLDGADLRRAELYGASFDGARLTGATLRGATLRAVSFVKASLTGADLAGADLVGADLSGADVSRADLSGADLTGACVEGWIAVGVKWDSRTVWPDGYSGPTRAD